MKKVIIFLIIFGSLLILGGAYLREQNIQARRAALFLQDQREAGSEVLQQIVRYERRFQSVAGQADSFVERADELVREVTGNPLVEKSVVARQVDVVEESVDETVVPELELPAEREPQPRRPRREARVEPSPDDFSSWDGEGPPPGMPTREELDRMRQRQRAPQVEEQQEEREADPDPVEKPLESAAPVAPAVARPQTRIKEEPAILKRARDMLGVREKLNDLRNEMAELVSRANDLQNNLNRTVDGASAPALVAALRDEAGFAESKLMDANTYIEDMRRIEVDLESLRRQAERERRKREEAEQARRAAAEHQALIEREKERVKAVHEIIKDDLRNYNFAKALETINQLGQNLETEEAQSGLALHRERYELLVNFKNYLIEQINAYPFRWGWVQDVGQKDVLEANNESVRVTDRVVPWEDVELAQFLRIVNHYISRPEARTRDRGDGNLAAAILCYELGREDLMSRFKAQALNLAPYLADKANRLLP